MILFYETYFIPEYNHYVVDCLANGKRTELFLLPREFKLSYSDIIYKLDIKDKLLKYIAEET